MTTLSDHIDAIDGELDGLATDPAVSDEEYAAGLADVIARCQMALDHTTRPVPRRRPPLVIAVRDPDYSNEFHVYGGDVEIHDVDLGRFDLGDLDEYLPWAAGHLGAADSFSEAGYSGAASLLRRVVEDHCPTAITDQYPEDFQIDWTFILEHAKAGGHA